MRWLRGLLAGVYSFLVFAGLHWLEPRQVALALALLLGARALALTSRRPSVAELRRLALPALLVGAVLVPTLWTNDPGALLFAPVWINAALFVAFARTLRGGPTLVETFARLRDPDLSDAQVRHCRHFTIAWCAFFVANAGVCAALALHADLWAWTLYTGGLSYLLIGALLAAEVGVRYWRFRNYQGSLFEPLLRRMLPRTGA
jgi:uncharacterized membrane protein